MPKLTLTSEEPAADFVFDSTIVIGRGGTADFVIPNPSVSRRHALVTSEDGDWFVEDIGSGNGTFLNDRVLSQRAILSSGDRIRLGSVVLEFTNTLAFDSTTPAPFTTSISMRGTPAAVDTEPDRVLVRVPVVEEQQANPQTLVGSARRLRLLENLATIRPASA